MTVTVNGVASLLSATLDSTATTPFVTATGSVPYIAGALIGISFSTTTVTIADPVVLTAQAFSNSVA
jgi:hypothetical protein